jgi:ATP-dependent helicase/nuclease subunit B
MKRVYNIPSQVAFTDDLADKLWRDAGGDSFQLAECLILLPTRRSARHLRDAFLRRMDRNAALLPRMQTLGDIDEEELYFGSDAALDLDIPPAIDPLRRQLLLTQLIRAKDDSLPFDQAAQLAKALAVFLDQVQIERCELKNLAGLVERVDLAEHWKQTVQFLDILTGAWPQMLKDEGCIDPADRRNRVLEAQAAAWIKTPPPHPVIAAGSTGTMPATADLLDVIAGMPQGCVILPGLDQQLDEEAWQAIDQTHPQAGMKNLLDKMKVERRDVKIWGEDAKPSPRVRLLNEAMRPAKVTEAWRDLSAKDIPRDALQGLSLVQLEHPQEEAQVIALALRHAVEDPQKTASLVTSDRDLAERVIAMLMRWGLAANDSAGTPLAAQPVGSYLRDILDAVAPQTTAVETLSLLKHPLAAWGLSPAECRARARRMELDLWRNDRPQASPDYEKLQRLFEPWRARWDQALPLAERIKAHIDLAETLAQSDTEKGANRLWQNEAGEAAAEWLDDWRNAAADFPALTGYDYAGLFGEMLRMNVLRPSYGQHPRISILGPLEARLIQSDVLILGGLNEGSWPPEAAIDPWMSRPMRQAFHLPSPERRIGLSAHDFVQLASAPNVMLTRSKRAGNAPTVPSRFLLQLDTVLRALGYETGKPDVIGASLLPPEPWQEWARLLDMPATPPQPCAAPEPKPPVAARPKKLSVTEIGTWRRNPYAIYARRILNLKKLEQLDAGIDASDRGTVIHAALDDFIKLYPEELPANALDELLRIGRDAFAAYDTHPEVKAFWQPRFERIARWFVTHEAARRASGIMPVMAEAEGKMTIGGLNLTGRADRIDRMPDGSLAIIDYKTGGTPTQKEIDSGYEPQLPLLALMAAQGGFETLDASSVAALAYWKLNGGKTVAKTQSVKGDIGALQEKALAGLENLIEAFANADTPYQAVPKPGQRPHYDDYAHLARLAEWGRSGEDE